VDKDWRLISGSALCGLLVAALILVYVKVSGEFDATLYTAFVIFCPPSLLCAFSPFSEAIKDKGSFYAIWSLIGITNSVLYAVIGAAVVGLRKNSV
jgi:hypothetical protein